MEMLTDYDTAHRASVLLPKAERHAAQAQVLRAAKLSTAPQARTPQLLAWLAAVGAWLRVRTVPRAAGGS